MAETDNVSNWSQNHVISWFKGLDDSLQCYIPNIEEASITGAQLLALTYEDLNNLGIVSIGHQEVILEATELLKQLHFDLDNENLQSRALDLNCRCRALRSSISSRKRNVGGCGAPEALSMGPNIPLLRLACEVLDSSKLLVMWLDRPPFWSQPEIRQVRGNLVRLSYELSTTVQQSVFACVIDDAAAAICKDMEISANNLIVSNDPLTIQPASLEVAHLVNKDSSAGLGLYIKATFEGHHVITGSKEGSISSRIRRIGLGDEVVAVSGQTVIGWQLSKLVGALKEDPSDISIALKKRPHLHAPSNTATPTPRRQVQERVLTVPPPVSPIRKVADSRKNSIEDVVDVPISNLPEENIKFAKKKHKLKKRKAKSASNLLSGSGGATKRSVNSQRNSVDSLGTSSRNSSLHSVSSAEMLSANNLTKNTGIRGSLENLLKRDKRSKKALSKGETRKKGKENKSKSAFSNSLDDLLKIKETGKSVSNNAKESKRAKKTRSASHNDVLSDTKDSSDSLIRTRQQRKSLSRDPDNQMVPEPPTSPLDFFVIPPPPQAPYTPRNENILRISIDSVNNLSSASQQMEKNDASESPNSLMDIEHCRRFTVIGTEQMGDKWYNSLLSEVNAKKAKRSRVAAKQALEKVAETTASDDSVFFNTTVETIPEEEIVVRRPKPRLINRPSSMPPNYYSPSKLQQFRINKGKMKSSLNEIPQVAHHVDSQGIKKLAPLNSISENADSSDVQRQSAGYRNSWSSNNNNNSANVLFQRETETLANSICSSSTGGNTVNASSYLRNMSRESNALEKPDSLSLESRVERPRSVSDGLHHQTGLLKMKTPIKQPSPVKQNQSKPDIMTENSSTKKPSIADELTKYFLRRKEGSMLEGQLYPLVISPTTSVDDSAFASPVKVKKSVASPLAGQRPMVPSTSAANTKQYPSPVATRKPIMPADAGVSQAKLKQSIPSPDKTRTPVMPPVAKPRTKLKSTIEAKSTTETDLQNSRTSDTTNLQSSPKKFLFESRKIDEFSQNQEPHLLENPATRLLANARSSPTSRGSYIAAIDVGYALESIKQEGFDKRTDGEWTSLNADSSSFKVVDGVKVRLRKPATKSNNKKGFLLEEMRSQRRISCRDLGQGECNGWLLKKKLNSNSSLSSKWTKRWVVLKDKAVYCYHTPDDDKAESYISLPGYQVTPAPECKKKFAFRVLHPKRKTFYFASDRQMDMSRWMNKMGLAAIEYGFPTQSNGNGDHSSKADEYYSESDSEETFLSQSETSNHTSSSTPNSSPEKATKLKTIAKTRSEYDATRQTPGQPILNRSARFPKEKAKLLHEAPVTTFTQTSDSLQRDTRNRSKSEAVIRTKVSEFQSTESSRHSSQSNVSLKPNSSPSEKEILSSDKIKHRMVDKRRKHFWETPRLSGSLEALHPSSESGRKSSHSDQELRNIAANRAEEVARRSSENISVTEIKETPKSTNGQGKVSPKPRSQTTAAESSPRRDIVGRPRVKTEASLTDKKHAETGSIGDLCKALQHAEVDIHGVKRRTTLRRKMTVLSRNPIKNESMLKKRALERQLKALEGELEYYNLLDEKKITSESLHQWINQHPSLFAELGTIRKMSKIRRKPAEDVFSAEILPETPEVASRSKLARPMSYSEVESSQKNDEKDCMTSDATGPTPYQSSTLDVVIPKPRPRSCAMSNSNFERIKPRPKTSTSSLSKNSSPIHSITRSEKGYLETDL